MRTVLVATLLAAAVGGCDPAFFLDWPIQSMRQDAARLASQGRYNEAAELSQGALRRRPRSRELEAELNADAGQHWLAHAEGLLRADRRADAILPLEWAVDHYRRAAELTPGRADVRSGLSQAFARQGRPMLAAQVASGGAVPNRSTAEQLEPAPALPPSLVAGVGSPGLSSSGVSSPGVSSPGVSSPGLSSPGVDATALPASAPR